MRILITTGIFEPEAGGPATYAATLATKLSSAGHTVTAVTYSTQAHYDFDGHYPFRLVRIQRGNRIVNRLKFFFTTLRHAHNCDLIYSLDWFAAGLPVALAAKLLEKPYIVRVGGDHAWERSALPMTLTDFYETGQYKKGISALIFSIVKYVLHGASRVVYNTDRQRDLYGDYYALPHRKAAVIYNPIPRDELRSVVRGSSTSEIVYWGRFTVSKNVTGLIRAFAQAKLPESYSLTLIGDGPERENILRTIKELGLQSRVRVEKGMRQMDALQRVKNAKAFVLPSWTDISPNQVYEALAIGLPAIVTKENYLSIHDELPEMIDPHSEVDIAAKLEMLAEPESYAAFVKRFRDIAFALSWKEVLTQHVDIFESTLGIKDMRVLSIGADRSVRGIMIQGTQAYRRQKAYAELLGTLDIIGLSMRSDNFKEHSDGRLHTYPTSSYSRLLYPLDALEIARELPKSSVISSQDPFETGLIAWVISLIYGKPLHMQVHTDFLSPAYAKHSIMNRLRVALARFVLSRASRVRVVSNRVKASIEKRYHLRVPVTALPIFVDLKRFSDANAPVELSARFSHYKSRLLVVSRLEAEKNVSLAIHALARSASNACLIIVGTGSERSKLESLAMILGVERRVFFEGDHDPAPYYKLADLVLVTSRYEGYGLVIVEALAAGKPVLSTDVGVARESGAIVSTPEKYSDALAQWLSSGPRKGILQNYPYKHFDEYVRAYCDDIKACTSTS